MKAKIKILILEDVKYDFELIKQELTKIDLSFQIIHADDQDSFEKAVLDFEPDLILSDFSLPQYDGMGALRYVLKLQKNIPVIIVTGSINEEVAVDCIKAGAADYVTKEHLSRLEPAIRGAIEKNNAISEKQKAERTQSVLFNIAEAAEKSESIEELSKLIHKELGNILDSTNFYISLYRPELDKYSFPFYKDQYDKIEPSELHDLKNSITDYVRKTGKPKLINAIEARNLEKNKNTTIIGKAAKVWIGAPLIDLDSNQIIGVTAIQNYKDEFALNEYDVNLLAFVARNIGSAIARTKSKVALQESEEQFRNLTETATDGIIMINDQGEINIWNKAAEQIFGFKKVEALGKDLHSLIMPNEYKDRNEIALREFISNGEGSIIGKTIELNAIHKKGHFIPIELSVSRIKKNNSWHATGIVRDISERKKVADELRIAKDKAEESDRLKTAFLANMSHEIRTPMNAILGFSELLSIPDVSEEERLEFIELIQNNSNMLLNLINDIIDIAKIEAGQLKLNHDEVLVYNLILDVFKTHSEANKKRNNNVEVRLDIPDRNLRPCIISDDYRIKQILSNLVGNALKYTEKGEVVIGYRVVNKEPKLLQFFVKDTGIGIPQDKLTLIFERFRQADDSYTREYGGTGLGLTISNNIANLLGGEIYVESEEGVGSTFTFNLPIKPCDMIEIPKTEKENSNGNVSLDSGTNILVAEDVESNYFLLETYLKKTNANIIWVKDGKQAVKQCTENKHINLILMDMQMPEMNGYEATIEIKKIRPELPIIAVTAFALAGDREKILNAGCDDYISKPIRRSELFEKIDRLL